MPSYPTGPATVPGATSNWAPLPEDVGDIGSAAILAASDIVYKYAGLAGFGKGIDWGHIIAGLAQSGQYNDPQTAFNWITFRSGQFDGNRVYNEQPWLLVGMNQDDYNQATEKLTNSFFNLTGGQPDTEMMHRAIQEGWSASDLHNFVQYGDPKGAGPSTFQPDLSEMPWIGTGQSYQQVSQNFEQANGKPPPDRPALASWFRFNQGAASVRGSSNLAQLVESAPGSQSSKMSRQPSDAEVR